MSDPQWETVEVPRGAYISWGEQPGVQEVIGKVVDYSHAGGTDFAGQPCPQVSLELRAPTFSINKAGQRTDHQAGDLVVLNAGLVSLKRAVVAMQMQPGDLIKIAYARQVPTSNGTVKEFDVQIARGAGTHPSAARPPQQQAQPPQQPQYAPPQQPAYAQQPPPQYAPAAGAPPAQSPQQPQYAPSNWTGQQQPAYTGQPQAQPPF